MPAHDLDALILRCPKCGQAVGVRPATSAWCIPCARRMRPITPRDPGAAPAKRPRATA